MYIIFVYCEVLGQVYQNKKNIFVYVAHKRTRKKRNMTLNDGRKIDKINGNNKCKKKKPFFRLGIKCMYVYVWYKCIIYGDGVRFRLHIHILDMVIR